VRRSIASWSWLVLLFLFHRAAPAGANGGTPLPTFAEGDVITFDRIAELRPFLPPELWRHRDFFFYDGMRLEIGPTMADYSPPPVWHQATARYAGQARVGPDDSLENYTTGTPFPEAIDCPHDPHAGVKHMWNFSYQWGGAGDRARYLYSYWDRGERLPLYYEGHAESVNLSRRVEPQYAPTGGDVFRGEKRRNAGGPTVDEPFDARGITLLTYRYKSSDLPRVDARNDDTWVYLPNLRRVRRISTAQRTDAVSGTDFTLDDLFSFNGVVPQYEWTCLGESRMIAPMNSRVRAYPYEKSHDFGPYGLSYASDRWELRDVVVVRMRPKNADHPYQYKDLYLDKQTFTAMYSFAYDQKGELWKIITHNQRWSEDRTLSGEYYPGWDDVPSPRDLHIVSDTIANVQTGTGNRIEFWDRSGTPMRASQVRRFIDVGRLTRGR
jgi:hypothetical protein